MAVTHSILIITNHLIKFKQSYHDVGGDYCDKRNSQVTAKRLTRRPQDLSYNINLDLPVTDVA